MLSDVKIKAAQPKAKDYKMGDRDGLYLLITPKGGKWWRYKYRILVGTKRVEKKGSLGTYPEVSLAQARLDHVEAMKLLRKGDDPVEVARKDKAAKGVEREKNRPFPAVVQEWYDELIVPNYKEGSSTLRRYTYNRDVLQAGIKVLIDDVRKADLTKVLLPYQKAAKHDTRKRIQVTALDIMEMAHDRGYIEVNHFATATFKSYTAATATRKPRPAVTDPHGFATLLCDIDKMPDRTASALRLLALLFLRPGELLRLKWTDVKWTKCMIVVPFELLKMSGKRVDTPAEGRNLEVPLSRQAIAELRELQRRTGNHVYLFPAVNDNAKTPHMRTFILNRALNRADYQGIHCPHGFRSSASTMLNAERRTIGGEEVERWVEQKALIELQLDHNDASVQAIYDRGGRWKDRANVMQAWADRIDEMREHGGSTKLRLVTDEARQAA